MEVVEQVPRENSTRRRGLKSQKVAKGPVVEVALIAERPGGAE